MTAIEQQSISRWRQGAAWALVLANLFAIAAMGLMPVTIAEDASPFGVNSGDDIVLFAFGYVGCPKVCPTTLSALARAYASLEEDGLGDRVAICFVDLTGETPPEAVSQWAGQFHPDFEGRASTSTTVPESLRALGVVFNPTADEPYHTTSIYLVAGGERSTLKGVYAAHPPDPVILAAWVRQHLVDTTTMLNFTAIGGR